MIIKRQLLFSETEKEFSKKSDKSSSKSKKMRFIDEDFLEDHEERKKNDRRGAKIAMTTVGGLLGSSVGMGITDAKKLPHGKLVLAGLGAGAAGGYYIGKKLGKKSDEKYDKFRQKYENSDEETREYLRRKTEKELDRRNIQSAAITAGSLAGRKW